MINTRLHPFAPAMLLRRGLRGFSVLLLLLLCAATSAASFQGSTTVRGTDNGAGVSWLAITINNVSSSDREGAVVLFSPSYRTDGVSGEIRVPFEPIPAGGSRMFNIAVPLLNIVSASVTEAGELPVSLNLDVYGYANSGSSRQFLLVNTPETLLTETQLDDFTRAMGGGRSVYSGYGMPSSPVTTAPLMAAERMITQSGVEDLPENWQCYIPMKALFMSESLEKRLTAGQQRALDTWINFGGEMVWYDSSTSATVRQGRGYITRCDKNPVITTSPTLQSREGPFRLGPDLMGSSMPYAVKTTGGQMVSFVLISIFMLVVGPINYIYFSRRAQIRRLLQTVPAISLAFCALIAIYFFATEGFTRNGGSISITTVDETTNRATTFARHAMMSGLYPIGGFHFDREAYLRTPTDSSAGNVQMILGKDAHLTRGLFRPKMTFDYLTVLPHGTRERMLLDGDATIARNGYELPVKAVAVLRDGKFYRGGAASSGGEVKLTPVEADLAAEYAVRDLATSRDAAKLIHVLGDGILSKDEMTCVETMIEAISFRDTSTSGALYAAILDGTPPGVESGVEITNGKNLHIVLGTPAPEAAQ